MAASKTPGRLERILAKAEQLPARPKKPKGIWAEAMATIRRRIIAGILFLLPIAVTIWFVRMFIDFIYVKLEPRLIRPLLMSWGMDPKGTAYWAMGVILSLIVVLLFLYFVGLITARRYVRYLVALGERLLVRIPFVKFFYKTTKQIVDTFAMPAKGSVKKVVLCDFFRTGMKTIAFTTGETPVEGYPRPFVNLFIPTTPNPTSGYVVMLPPEEVFETDLTVEEGVRFIVSGGILPPDLVRTFPYQSSELLVAEGREERLPLPAESQEMSPDATDAASGR